MSSGVIHVINPNSTTAVTAGVDASLGALRFSGGPAIVCHTLEQGPAGIQSEADIAAVTALLIARARSFGDEAIAIVIACYSDPGLAVLREQSSCAVFGIGEAAVLRALAAGQRFGVIAIQPGSISRHLRSYGAMGVMDRFAGERALGLDVVELNDQSRTWARLLEVGERLRDEDGAEVLILGCAGLGSYRLALAQALGVPVIDPCIAAVTMALGEAR
ncbi:aspartate/glutamate racemase family protein [Halotalea alkalilenta]|uniref:Asp/Glu racemase n=1 Tax=Halotalea alkalilenta TaxID=376489 RepID=A0A172YDH0_9GAMM|nr:aspartate/glutamate racemase family protein [Halotalea alkalilenta]ANF57132.1 Asp/Glu racemase [Halotalea alkalilenta]